MQFLHGLGLEEGMEYIREHCAKLHDHAAPGNLIKDEAQRQEHISPLLALKLAELLIFFGTYVDHAPSYALGLLAKGNVLMWSNRKSWAEPYGAQASSSQG
ncbi:hypothetical protein EPA93_37865 [Ktedonosporobacter rubrisoli]|uniref:Uncharacterized protein n=1 Tax=Ktedonosporobacter rubrisoli TaxID=2509675 RepID=A0A4P6K0F3_KTERU|nr:hypothetical protein [Ktedonosporobacter rubrisoli]QBD81435.1 hypothetical protein EPA93_37865 [Ktedonosporobacter rubrisoli]